MIRPPLHDSALHDNPSHAKRFDVGDIRLERIVESEFPVLDPFELYPDFTAQHLADNLRWLAPRFYDLTARLLIIALQGFVIRSHGKTILVDTCVGDCKKRVRAAFDRQQWNWLDRLAQTGLCVEDIDYVVCSHFHVDHVGWNTRWVEGKWVPTFPRARYLFAQAEWDYWWSEAGRAGRERTGDYIQDSVVPVAEAGLVDFVEMDHRIDASVSLVPAPGHTPGLVCVAISSQGQDAVLAGDVLHTPLQLAYPAWSTNFCADPNQSRRTRLQFLERYADSGTLILPAHFPAPTAGYIERDERAYRFRFHR
jgi:glyoxylase-like metal-dependent hydrolase (beta-lactamase superfamily II)